MPTPDSIATRLCLACGLCCDGTLFKDVELQPGDDAATLESAQLPLERLKTKTRFPQPCAALCADLRCRVYADRPSRCRQFECGLFKSVLAGRMTAEVALRAIGKARQRADKVRRLLRELGDDREHVALSVRFKRMQSRMERGIPDEAAAGHYADLTLAVHDLNVLLHDAFLVK